jgi:hypothetical protein
LSLNITKTVNFYSLNKTYGWSSDWGRRQNTRIESLALATWNQTQPLKKIYCFFLALDISLSLKTASFQFWGNPLNKWQKLNRNTCFMRMRKAIATFKNDKYLLIKHHKPRKLS